MKGGNEIKLTVINNILQKIMRKRKEAIKGRTTEKKKKGLRGKELRKKKLQLKENSFN
jgi:hypothetical protein